VTRRWLTIDPSALPAVSFLLLLGVVGFLGSPGFLTTDNIGNVLKNVTPLLLVAVGQTFVIACRGLDLSVGVTATLTATLIATGFPLLGWVIVPIALGAAFLVGAFNGVGVRSGLNPFLMTLASLSIVQGLIFTYRPTTGGTVPVELAAIAGLVGPIPVALPIVVASAGLAAVILRWTRLGSHILASGGDPVVARLSGVRVGRSQLAAYALCATAAGFAGLFLAARTRTGDPLIGTSLTLDSVVAVVLGGSLLAGGRVTLLGTLVGSFCLGLLPNVLNLTGVPYFYQQLIKGALLIAAVLLPAAVTQVRTRRARSADGNRLVGRESGGPGDAGPPMQMA
jgi:ribose transport system permease protein